MWFAGIDWSDKKHDVVVIDEAGRKVAQLRVMHSPEGLSKLVSFLKEIGPLDQLACILETSHGLLWRTAVDSRVLLKNLLNLGGDPGIFPLMGTRLSFLPGIIAAFRNLKRPTHHSNRVVLQVIFNELILSPYGREKMPIAFLARHAPAASVHFRAVIGGFLPQVEADVHFQERLLSRVLQSAGTNG